MVVQICCAPTKCVFVEFCCKRHSPRVRIRPNDTLMVQLDVKICDLHYLGGSEPDMRFILDHSEQGSVLLVLQTGCIILTRTGSDYMLDV
jgi:hypothetical protein